VFHNRNATETNNPNYSLINVATGHLEVISVLAKGGGAVRPWRHFYEGGTISYVVGYKPVPVGCIEIKVVLISGHYSQLAVEGRM